MIFDGHGDIWTDITMKRLKGEKNIIKNHHLDRFKKGDMLGGIFVIWVDPPYDKEPEKRTLEIIQNMSSEILDNQDILKIVKTYDDFQRARQEEKLAVIIGMEGLSGIGDRVDLIDSLYLLGVRHMALSWNEENHLATGVLGDPERGLTELGFKAVRLMEKRGIIIDTAHANEKTFWDIMEASKGPIINSHSNSRVLCDHPRNLWDDQIKEIAKRGGLIGINAFNEFIDLDRKYQDINHLVKHINHMVGLVGIDHLAFGFDFFHYLKTDTIDSFVDDVNIGTRGLEDISKAGDLIKLLKKEGYSKEDIEKISYKNYERLFKEILKKD